MKVTLPYDPVWKALQWAKIHCPDYVTNKIPLINGVYRPDYVDYFFSSDCDATFFSLKWK